MAGSCNEHCASSSPSATRRKLGTGAPIAMSSALPMDLPLSAYPTSQRDKTAATTPKTRPRSRDKRKDELLFLRQRSKELELQLQMLKQPRTSRQKGSDRVQQLFELSWRSVAKRQLGKRQRCEEENRQLKRSLSENFLTARTLQLLIRERLAVQQQVMTHESKETQSPNRPEWTANDLAIIHQLSTEVDGEYARVDAVLQQQSLQNPLPDANEEIGFATVTVVPLETSDDVLYIDLRATSLVPFPFERVCDVAWMSIKKLFNTERHGKPMSCAEMDNPDCLAVKLPTNLPMESTATKVDVECPCRLVMRRYVEANRVVWTWRGQCDDEYKSTTMVTDETGWCVFEPAASSTGSGGAAGGTIFRGCVHVIPIGRDTELPQRSHEVWTLIQKLVEGLNNEMSGLKALIEDSLLQESVAFSNMSLA